MTWLMIALGAAVGAPGRYLVDTAVTARFGSRLPWGTLLVNVVGSAALGVLAGRMLASDPPPGFVALVGTGFCGAFTTASTFAWEALALAGTGRPRAALAYVGLTLWLTLTAAGIGLTLAR